MFQLDNSTNSNKSKTLVAPFLEILQITVLIPVAPGKIFSKCFEQWSMSNKSMNRIFQRISCNQLFIRSVVRFIKLFDLVP